MVTNVDSQVEVIDLLQPTPYSCSVAASPDPHGAVAAVIDGVPVMCGGRLAPSSCFEYRNEDDDWRYLSEADMDHRRVGAAAAAGDGDSWWITGGNVGTTETEVFDGGRTHVNATAGLPWGMEWHSLVRVNSSHLVVFGGRPFSHATWIYDSSADRWRYLNGGDGAMSKARLGAFAGTVVTPSGEVEVVAAGGKDRNHEVLASTEIFSLSSLRWRAGPDLPVPAARGQSVPWGPTFVVLGGLSPMDPGQPSEDGSTKETRFYEFDGINGRWVEHGCQRAGLGGTNAAYVAFNLRDDYELNGCQ